MKTFILRRSLKSPILISIFTIWMMSGIDDVHQAWISVGDLHFYQYLGWGISLLLIAFSISRIFQYFFPSKIIFEDNSFKVVTPFNTKSYNYLDSRIARIGEGVLKFDKIYDNDKKSLIFDSPLSDREFMDMFKHYNMIKLQKELVL